MDTFEESKPFSSPLGPLKGHKRKGMKVTFKDLRYDVQNTANKKETLHLLQSVTGFIAPGQMTALMGPSGSGKTTLLDVLAGRKTAGTTQGDISFAGQAPTISFLRRHTGYVEQFDTLVDNLTVREMLMYTAELKLPMSQSLAEKRARVTSIIELLALLPCQNRRIGNAMQRGISGGQAKRTNIGIALVTSPRVLFLDEPTSGLDSFTSNEVMDVIKSLSQTEDSMTICATIHSPTAHAFALFGKMIILLQGRMVFFGDAEWIVNITTKADRDGKAGAFADKYAASALKASNDEEQDGHAIGALKGAKSARASVMTLKELSVTEGTVTPAWWAIKTLLKYRMGRDFMDAKFIGPRVFDKFTVCILMMTLYWGIGNDYKPTNLINISALLYMWAILPGFAALTYVPALVLERPLFIRERSDGLYKVITYLTAKLLEELTVALIGSLIFSCVVFFPSKFQGDWVLFWLAYWCTMSIGIVLGYFIAAMSPNLDVANASLPAYVGSLLFFVGCLLRVNDMPGYWRWYSYLNFLRYGWGALMVNQFEGKNAIFLGGEEILHYYSLDNCNKWAFLACEFAFFVGFFMASWLALTYRRHSSR
ncbi:hypothetical protein WJX84_007302 [Apatococcus fuscideae]|uniref:ABC transporter domain-containing protein n=1 Tax=Apatococcus fuscideae TaxID=2026836 RepID=A0AAW1TDX4_9CHLO